jgi:23S rRNA-/tRNA-specific pseudouridylate synthase
MIEIIKDKIRTQYRYWIKQSLMIDSPSIHGCHYLPVISVSTVNPARLFIRQQIKDIELVLYTIDGQLCNHKIFSDLKINMMNPASQPGFPSQKESRGMYLLRHQHLEIAVSFLGIGWILVEKPAGLSIHNDPGKDLCSILNEHAHHDSSFSRTVAYDSGFGFNAVNRLDRETSGLLILACNRSIFRYFSKQFQTRAIRKQYVAILHGIHNFPDDKDEWRIWDWPLSEKGGSRNNPRGNGKLRCCEKL